MTANEVGVGKFYVNERLGLIREIVADDDRYVSWQAYDLKSGQVATRHGLCSKYQIIQWADREASPEEIAGLRLASALSDKQGLLKAKRKNTKKENPYLDMEVIIGYQTPTETQKAAWERFCEYIIWELPEESLQ